MQKIDSHDISCVHELTARYITAYSWQNGWMIDTDQWLFWHSRRGSSPGVIVQHTRYAMVADRVVADSKCLEAAGNMPIRIGC